MRMSSVSAFVLVAALAALAGCNRKPAEPSPAAKPEPAAKQEPVAQPASGWQISSDQATWVPVALPSTAWGCDRCDRYFMRTVQGVPKSVTFRFASDNQARLLVNGTEVFAEFWKDKYCTDAPCCGKCCDSVPSCNRIVAAQKPFTLSLEALKAFKDGENKVVWQVHQDTGGSGFHVEMDFGR
jgi:hypothetical protein